MNLTEPGGCTNNRYLETMHKKLELFGKHSIQIMENKLIYPELRTVWTILSGLREGMRPGLLILLHCFFFGFKTKANVK